MNNRHSKNPKGHHRNAEKLRATTRRLTAALEALLTSGRPFKNISALAQEVGAICGLDRSLLLKKDLSYRKMLDSYPSLLIGYEEAATPYNQDVDPLHAHMIRLNELERENKTLRKIIDDLSKRFPPAPTVRDIPDQQLAQPPALASAPTPKKEPAAHSYQYEYEVTCQLVDQILDYRPAFKLKDEGLVDVSAISGIPKTIAEPKLTTPYTNWKKHRTYVG